MSVTQFALLGPLRVSSDGTALAVPPGKQRAVLAALLLRANQVVSVAELAEALWGADPPAAARVSVQNYVMRLRKSLLEAGPAIHTRPGGYLISVSRDALDIAGFEEHVRSAHSAARNADWPTAAAQAHSALELWRGDPLADVSSDLLVAREGPRLAELRQQAVEIRLDADIHLGRHAEAIADLQRLTSEHPLRENLHGLLMLALYRDGRQGEALTAYLHVRQTLIAELGTEPGPDLQRLHQQILEADPALEPPESLAVSGAEAGNVAGGGPAVVPRELPAPVGHFTGRAAELAELDRVLLGRARQADTAKPAAAVISAVSGTAGVGKTALAIHWAHHAAAEFSDGQLYVNLRGYDPEQPVAAADALAGFLRSLGVPGQDIPAEAQERAARYRSLLAGNRVLVVLDNAGSVEQVRPLLPGSPHCATVVTSRDALAGLVARDGATRVDLDLLPLDDAAALLRGLIGSRAEHDPRSTRTLAECCARLPLALRVAAELAAARPDVSLAVLVAELADQQRRLDLLDAGGDALTAVRAVFSWSYRNFDADTARTFRLAGLHPGADFDNYAVAALAGTTLDQATANLDALVRGHMVQRDGSGRYNMHDLLREYARELVSTEEGPAEQRAASTRLFDYYLHTAARAVDALYPGRQDGRPRVPAPAAPVPALADPVAARTWLDSEQSALVAVATTTADNGWPTHATRLAATLYWYLQDANSQHEATLFGAAIRAARQTGDLAAVARALNGLAGANWRLGRYADASDQVTQALAIYREIGDLRGEADTLQNLGVLTMHLGPFDRAAEYERAAVRLYRQLGHIRGEASALNSLAIAFYRTGDYSQASEHFQQALAISRKCRERRTEAFALGNLGELAQHQGRLRQAAEYQHQALAAARQIGNRNVESRAHSSLAIIARLNEHHDEAISLHLQGIGLARQIGERAVEAEALNDLGETLLAAGQAADARAHLGVALAIATQIGERYLQARAHEILGRVHRATGRDEQARADWQQALELYTALGAADAGRVRAELGAQDETFRSGGVGSVH